MSVDPFGRAVEELIQHARRALEDIGIEVSKDELRKLIEIPPSEELGDLALPVFRIAKRYRVKPQELASTIANYIASQRTEFITRTYSASGYVNTYIDAPRMSEELFKAVEALGDRYGEIRAEKPLRIVVEFVSANPIHPLHVGSGRNAALGDVLSNLLEARGHTVQRRFYINDMGRQVATLIYGYLALGRPEPPPDVKPDHWLGAIYAVTCTLIDIRNLRSEVEKLKHENPNDPELQSKLKELDELVAVAARLRDNHRELFDKLSEYISKDPDPESRISEIMKRYELGDPEVKSIVRRVIEWCLKGFRETLSRMYIEFDAWDWESDLVWSGNVKEIIERARSTPHFTYHKGAPALTFSELLKSSEIREKLKIPKTLEIPPLILMRSDGTTLYQVRDIAYSIKKFREFSADKVINVIGAEQVLAQAQLRLALYALGYTKEAENLIHYSYEMVTLPGMRMSSRRGQYVSLDELLDMATKLSMEELRKRGSEDYEIARTVGAAAVKFALASVSPTKPVTLRVEDIVNFERNSAPYLLYTYARANGILLKAKQLGIEPENPDYRAANENSKRRRLIVQLSKFPRVVAKAADDMDPEILATYLLGVADVFNSWYVEDPVIHEQDPGKRSFKLLLVKAVRTVIGKGLRIMGIKPLERM